MHSQREGLCVTLLRFQKCIISTVCEIVFAEIIDHRSRVKMIHHRPTVYTCRPVMLSSSKTHEYTIDRRATRLDSLPSPTQFLPRSGPRSMGKVAHCIHSRLISAFGSPFSLRPCPHAIENLPITNMHPASSEMSCSKRMYLEKLSKTSNTILPIHTPSISKLKRSCWLKVCGLVLLFQIWWLKFFFMKKHHFPSKTDRKSSCQSLCYTHESRLVIDGNAGGSLPVPVQNLEQNYNLMQSPWKLHCSADHGWQNIRWADKAPLYNHV